MKSHLSLAVMATLLSNAFSIPTAYKWPSGGSGPPGYTGAPNHPNPPAYSGSPIHPGPTATIDSGVVVGQVTSLPDSDARVNQFFGIPFAKPPLANLRFAPPQSPNNWSNPLKVTVKPPACIQEFQESAASGDLQSNLFNNPPPPSGESEDCLYLNAYVPSGGCQTKSVMFWLYGGGYIFGSNSLPMYDGTSFAANQDVIIVAPNYRTNVFGYPGSPQLPLTGQNLGHLDQRLALDWVHRNIAAFGGDPKKVTIFGESAGAESVDDLICTMPNNPPFRAAILESGQSTIRSRSFEQSANSSAWESLMAELKCTGPSPTEILACARAANATTIRSITNKLSLPFGQPVADNVTRVSNAEELRAAGRVAQVPILIGSNFNDGTAFTYGQNNVTAFLSLFGSGAPAIEKLYPQGTPGLKTGSQEIATIFTDFTFRCPADYVANVTINKDRSPAWLYLFNATFPNTKHPQLPGLGVYHSSEIPLVFGTYPTANATDGEIALSKYMQKSWANFAKTPSAGPGWKQWPALQVLDATKEKGVEVTTVASALDKLRCAGWQLVYQKLGLL